MTRALVPSPKSTKSWIGLICAVPRRRTREYTSGLGSAWDFFLGTDRSLLLFGADGTICGTSL